MVVIAVGAVIMLRENGFAAVHRQPGAAATGAVFPDITVDDVDGTPITTSMLAGKSTLVWFSDSSCPDISGVGRIARLDDDTGGDALQILVVFIDQRSASPVARQWRDVFGRPDWLVAADHNGAVSATLGIRAPETKVLLDQHATVVDTHTGLVDDPYLRLLQKRVQP